MSVLGMFMMGGLSASMVNVYTTAQIPTGEGTVMAIQGDILDAVAPGLLTLATVLLVYKYLRSGHSMMKATFWILGIALVLGAVGIIGDGGFLIKPIMNIPNTDAQEMNLLTMPPPKIAMAASVPMR